MWPHLLMASFRDGPSTHLSKCVRRRFSIANQTMIPNASHITHPVTPGPVAKLYSKNPLTPLMMSYVQ